MDTPGPESTGSHGRKTVDAVCAGPSDPQMAEIVITIEQDFRAPVSEVFMVLSDHEELGRILSTQIHRIRDASGKNVNGVGSVRRIKSTGVPAFEETVTALEPDQLIEYKVTKGSPIKNHIGRLEFSESGGVTHLHYTIRFEPRLPIPLWGSILKVAIRAPIANGLRAFAKTLAT